MCLAAVCSRNGAGSEIFSVCQFVCVIVEFVLDAFVWLWLSLPVDLKSAFLTVSSLLVFYLDTEIHSTSAPFSSYLPS